MGLLQRIIGGQSSGESDDMADRRRVDSDGPIVAVMADGSTAYFDADEWVWDETGRLWIASVSRGDVPVGSRLQNPPVSVHLPVEEMTARFNRWEKSEADARVIRDVERYSKVVNPSDDPDRTVDLNVPYLELWV